MRGGWGPAHAWGARGGAGAVCGSESRVGCPDGVPHTGGLRARRCPGVPGRGGCVCAEGLRDRAGCEPRVGCALSGTGGSASPQHPAPPRSTQTGRGGPFSPTWCPEPLAPDSQPPPACKSFAFTILPLTHYHTNFICLRLMVAIKLARFPGLACPPGKQGVGRRRRLGDAAPGPPGRQVGREGCSRAPGLLGSVGLGYGLIAALRSGWSREGVEGIGLFGGGGEGRSRSQLQSFSPSAGPTDVLFSSPSFPQGRLHPPSQ